jgi:hypothetical protein
MLTVKFLATLGVGMPVSYRMASRFSSPLSDTQLCGSPVFDSVLETGGTEIDPEFWQRSDNVRSFSELCSSISGATSSRYLSACRESKPDHPSRSH